VQAMLPGGFPFKPFNSTTIDRVANAFDAMLTKLILSNNTCVIPHFSDNALNLTII